MKNQRRISLDEKVDDGGNDTNIKESDDLSELN
jgi:hypothetical protein